MIFLSMAASIATSSGTAGELHLGKKGGQRVCSPCHRQHPDRPEHPEPWILSSPTLLEGPPAAVLVAPHAHPLPPGLWPRMLTGPSWGLAMEKPA